MIHKTLDLQNNILIHMCFRIKKPAKIDSYLCAYTIIVMHTKHK